MDTHNGPLPIIIQGGMGVGVSGWRLARAVSRAGQLGVVSGTALSLLLTRRLQMGDPDGHVRRALEHFPFPEIARRILERYYIAGGKASDKPFKAVPFPGLPLNRFHEELLVVGNFVEVFLAKEGHDGLIGINYLEKIQFPTLASIYGAMLAGVDFVLMGAGIPKSIPGALDALSEGHAAKLKIDVHNAGRDDEYCIEFDPGSYTAGNPPHLKRPKFLAIISSATLATMLVRRSNGHVDGFVVEGPSAGGHNAPPRGPLQLTQDGEPIYTQRDDADLAAIAALGLPFWLAGSYGEPDRVVEALAAGATGVQVGTAFAYCNESDLDPEVKQTVLRASCVEGVRVFTDPVASPTGFPFKVVQLKQTLADEELYRQRKRVCDLGYLRHAYIQPDGELGWRCPAEPVEDFVRKGGREEETHGRKCVCNALFANISLGQVRKNGETELALITSGLDAKNLARFLKKKVLYYSAAEVISYLLSALAVTVPSQKDVAVETPLTTVPAPPLC